MANEATQTVPANTPAAPAPSATPNSAAHANAKALSDLRIAAQNAGGLVSEGEDTFDFDPFMQEGSANPEPAPAAQNPSPAASPTPNAAAPETTAALPATPPAESSLTPEQILAKTLADAKAKQDEEKAAKEASERYQAELDNFFGFEESEKELFTEEQQKAIKRLTIRAFGAAKMDALREMQRLGGGFVQNEINNMRVQAYAQKEITEKYPQIVEALKTESNRPKWDAAVTAVRAIIEQHPQLTMEQRLNVLAQTAAGILGVDPTPKTSAPAAPAAAPTNPAEELARNALNATVSGQPPSRAAGAGAASPPPNANPNPNTPRGLDDLNGELSGDEWGSLALAIRQGGSLV